MNLPIDSARLIALLRERQPRTANELSPLLGVRPRDLPTIVGWITENMDIVIDSRCRGSKGELGYSIYEGDDLAVIEHFKRRIVSQLRHYNRRKRIIIGRKRVRQVELF